jgi:hypothetical protein
MKNDLIKERCQRICGNTGDQCLIRNKGQVDCISDMFINNVCNIKGIVETAREKVRCGDVADLLDSASEAIDELISWIKYLQGPTR